MKVLSLIEPWATLIKNGNKKIETRSWKTSYRGELYIHASSTKVPKEVKTRKELISLIGDSTLNFGHIVCRCKLVDCVYMTKEYVEEIKNNNKSEYICGEYKEGRYAWILEDVTPIEIKDKVKGKLGIWNYDEKATLESLNIEYDRLQKKYGAAGLDAIYNGGCRKSPDICFVFMNPTGKNVASAKTWKGPKSPWIGTKNIWDLFYQLNLTNKDIYNEIKLKKGSEWTEEFAKEVYDDVEKHKFFITNLGKCTQIDARQLPDSVYQQYLGLLKKEFEIIKPKVIILFGNQVSSIVLDEKISVSQCRKKCYIKDIDGTSYKFYPVYYPVGNGRFNIDKCIEDLRWIIDKELEK